MPGKSRKLRRSRGDETQTKNKSEAFHVLSYQDFVSNHARLFREGKKLSSRHASPRPQPKLKPNAPVALNFSPHPDDECIVGGLALRLRRESGFRVINVAVTLGSKPERRTGRLRELTAACHHLDFGLEEIQPGGLEKITPATRDGNTVHWEATVRATAALIWRHKPRVILLPHIHDHHPTHIGTHLLAMDALLTLPATFQCVLVETEVWGQQTTPNLIVESSINDVTDLVTALAMHVGEVKRNPYHLRLPAWMMDNVRRGAELAGKIGGGAPDFVFGTLYRVRRWKDQSTTEIPNHKRLISCKEVPDLGW